MTTGLSMWYSTSANTSILFERGNTSVLPCSRATQVPATGLTGTPVWNGAAEFYEYLSLLEEDNGKHRP
ncbi:uncharacterized protein N7473_011778 [Penicillium subrubescens]|uniref:Uncharacterized protein n=1 Tax=Penicillium subrubescens TaxID=1316194 RepID=A0A1Q5TM31_9EURO|nr:uncharacterized protein N7473_011778 [Penicillium subrubescens]KAJ5880725.1 hypothetical protein N7473_011778 [Penicillium subrubescens]OKP01298.1 hypothetical protein PENSUB_7288 [Penicillium subrubescens]